MKRHFEACSLLAGLLALGCQQSNGPHPRANNTTTTTSHSSTTNPAPGPDHETAQTTTTTERHAQNTNPPAGNPSVTSNYGSAGPNHPANPPANASSAPVSSTPSPEQFVMQAHEDNVAEIQLAKLAESKATHAEVKNFAQRMVADHTKLNEQLESAAKQQKLQLPQGPQLNPEHQQLADQLSKMSGDEFDRTYMEHMVPDHQKAVQKFQQEASNGQNQALKDLAGKALPTLQEHLRLAEQAARAVGASANASNH